VWKSGLTSDKRREMTVAALEMVSGVMRWRDGKLRIHDHEPVDGG